MRRMSGGGRYASRRRGKRGAPGDIRRAESVPERRGNAMADLFVCARCACVYSTCCRMDPEHTELCFPLSEPERLRLVPHAGKAGVPSSQVVATTPLFLRSMKTLFHGQAERLERRFPIPGEHTILPILSDGSCAFLQEDGCGLPRDARPWYCRLFPVWFRKGKPDVFVPAECLLVREAKTPGAVLEALGLDESRAMEMYHALCRDWELA